MLSESSGASCGLENVKAGRRYVFFAGHESKQGKDPDHLWANLCGGTAPTGPELIAEVESATGAGKAPPPAEPDETAYGGEGETLLSAWAWPLALAAGSSLVLLTVPLWIRQQVS